MLAVETLFTLYLFYILSFIQFCNLSAKKKKKKNKTKKKKKKKKDIKDIASQYDHFNVVAPITTSGVEIICCNIVFCLFGNEPGHTKLTYTVNWHLSQGTTHFL